MPRTEALVVVVRAGHPHRGIAAHLVVRCRRRSTPAHMMMVRHLHLVTPNRRSGLLVVEIVHLTVIRRIVVLTVVVIMVRRRVVPVVPVERVTVVAVTAQVIAVVAVPQRGITRGRYGRTGRCNNTTGIAAQWRQVSVVVCAVVIPTQVAIQMW